MSFIASKITGWFRNQRTALGKLLKKKSGQASEPNTRRGRWQLASFHFLKAHILPRTYQHDTGLPGEPDAEEEDKGDEESDIEISSPPSTSKPLPRPPTKRARGWTRH